MLIKVGKKHCLNMHKNQEVNLYIKLDSYHQINSDDSPNKK